MALREEGGMCFSQETRQEYDTLLDGVVKLHDRPANDPVDAGSYDLNGVAA
jgi:hypothetical protein